jgi:hypothetical protein
MFCRGALYRAPRFFPKHPRMLICRSLTLDEMVRSKSVQVQNLPRMNAAHGDSCLETSPITFCAEVAA